MDSLKVLLVEDDLDLAEELAELLAESGFDVASAPNARTVDALCQERVFDLALVDLELGKRNGLEAVSPFLGAPGHRGAIGNVIVLSGRSPTGAELAILPRPCLAWLSKSDMGSRLIELCRSTSTN